MDKIIREWKQLLLEIAALWISAGCDQTSKQPDPSLAVTFRRGVLSDLVLQVSNMSGENSLNVYVYVADKIQSLRSGNIILHPNSTQELGALEVDWNFKSGDKGFVSAEGFKRKLYFEVDEGQQFRSWFGVDDIPEVDVAAQVRAEREAAAQQCVQTLKAGVMAFKIRYPGAHFVKLRQLVEGDDEMPPIIDGGKDVLIDPWGNEYRYESRGKGFAIFSCGADGKAGTKDDIRSDKKRRSNGKFDSLFDETANPKSDK